MNIADKRKELADWILGADEDTLAILLELMQSENKDWWTSLSQEQKAMIEEGQNDLEEGRVVPHDQVKKMYGL